MNWNDVFEYRDGQLYWKIRPANRVKVGDIAGSKNNKGYLLFDFKGKKHPAHRVIWEMHYGTIPDGMEIDHINHIRDDNRIENLRLASHAENTRNMSKHKYNTSGVTGVCWHKHQRKWVAQIMLDGKYTYLGYFVDFDEAVRRRKSAELNLGFHSNHGDLKRNEPE
ncbi:HNH endonuclease [Salmonella phage LPSTLL]|uniref:HNH nuclease domain-containing protein n=1 Tax=Salmonella phage LPSTLL TaxID=3071280 RepID=A0A8E3ZZ57_9CAUD|nr:HNH endonuclease [Salmonella phage LPSTLL]QGZ15006.1 hypothetical protein vBSalSLPSTLL_orf00048 [Salmonella phage LPSTLL]